MRRKPCLSSLLAAAFLLGGFSPRVSSAGLEPCKGWCVEADAYWFQVLFNKGAFRPPDADDLAHLDRLPNWLKSVSEYLLQHPTEVAYKAAVLPIKPGADPPEFEAHSVHIDWNFGVTLTSGETVWATQWFLLSPGNNPAQRPQLGSVSLTSDMLLPTRDFKTYALILAFPSRTSSGREWSKDDIAAPVITHEETAASTSVAKERPGVGHNTPP